MARIGRSNQHIYLLEEYFKTFNRELCKLSESSVNHYCDSIRKISEILVRHNLISESLYEITDLDQLDKVRMFLENLPEFRELDERGHRMYSCGFKKYYEFALGDTFQGIGRNIETMDHVSLDENIPTLVTTNTTTFRRSNIIKSQVIKCAEYKCELDGNHITFTSASTLKPYMEAHHIIALMNQKEFNKNLDIYSNVICLCPICHRLLHYGIEKEKLPILERIFTLRQERLAMSGLILTKNDFLDLTLHCDCCA